MNGAVTATLSQGATAETNRAALQAALDTGRSVHIPRGLFPLAPGAVAKAPGQVVFGEGPHASLLRCQGEGDFLSDGEWWGFEVRDLNFTGSVDGMQEVTGGNAINLDGVLAWHDSARQMPNTRIQRVRMEGMWTGVFIQDQNNMIADGLEMQAMRGDGVVVLSLNDNLRTDCITLRDVIFSPHPDAVAAGRGTGLIVDGNVHTIRLDGFNIVAPLRGVEIRNSAGLPLGHHAAFFSAADLYVDFPEAEAMRVTAVDRMRLARCYFHGSRTSHGLVIEAGARDVEIAQTNITSHARCGILHAGQDLELVACDLDNNGQAGGKDSGLRITSAARVNLVGGSISGPHQAYAVERTDRRAVVDVFGTRLEGTRAARSF